MSAITKPREKSKGARTELGTKRARAALSRNHMIEGPRLNQTKGFKSGFEDHIKMLLAEARKEDIEEDIDDPRDTHEGYLRLQIKAIRIIGRELDKGKTCKEADDLAEPWVSGASHYLVATMVSRYHARGEEFRKWHNGQMR